MKLGFFILKEDEIIFSGSFSREECVMCSMHAQGINVKASSYEDRWLYCVFQWNLI